MKILVTAFVYLGEDAGSTHVVEVWRHLMKKNLDIMILLPQLNSQTIALYSDHIDFNKVHFAPFTKRPGRKCFKKIKFIWSTICLLADRRWSVWIREMSMTTVS